MSIIELRIDIKNAEDAEGLSDFLQENKGLQTRIQSLDNGGFTVCALFEEETYQQAALCATFSQKLSTFDFIPDQDQCIKDIDNLYKNFIELSQKERSHHKPYETRLWEFIQLTANMTKEGEAPNRTILLCFLGFLAYLKTSTSDTKIQEIQNKLLVDLERTYSISGHAFSEGITAVNQSDEIIQLLQTPDTPIFFPHHIQHPLEDRFNHTLQIAIKKQSNGSVLLKIINTGYGIREHGQFMRTRKAPTIISFEIPSSDSTGCVRGKKPDDIIRNILLQLKKLKNKSSEEFYSRMRDCMIINGGHQLPYPINRSIQKGGTCASRSIWHIVKDLLSLEDYLLLRSHFSQSFVTLIDKLKLHPDIVDPHVIKETKTELIHKSIKAGAKLRYLKCCYEALLLDAPDSEKTDQLKALSIQNNSQWSLHQTIQLLYQMVKKPSSLHSELQPQEPAYESLIAIWIDYVKTNIDDYDHACEEVQSNTEVALEFIRQGGDISRCSSKMRENLKIIQQAVSINGHALAYASNEIKETKRIVLMAVENRGLALEYTCKLLQGDRDVVVKAIENAPFAIEFASNEFKNNREIVLLAIKANGYALKFASSDLKNKQEIVLAAVNNKGASLRYAGDDLKRNQQIVLAAIMNDGKALFYAHPDLQNNTDFIKEVLDIDHRRQSVQWITNKSIIMDIIKKDASIFEHINETLQRDREIALEAIKEDSNYYEEISEELKEDPEIALAAIKQDGNTLFFVADTLQNNADFISQVLEIDPSRQSIRWITNKNIIRSIIQKDAVIFKHINEKFKENPQIALEAVKKRGNLYKDISKKLKQDRHFLYQVIGISPDNAHLILYADQKLREDTSLVMSLVQKNGHVLEHVSDDFKNNSDIVRTAVQEDGLALEHASDALKSDESTVLKAVRQDGLALEYASKSLQGKRNIVVEAIHNNASALEYASESIKNDLAFLLTLPTDKSPVRDYPDDELSYDDRYIKLLLEQAIKKLNTSISIFSAYSVEPPPLLPTTHRIITKA